ncbi:MAG: hypothetical protein JXA79_11420 [Deltaproteobacteria bacterium]|nr:hypothetical protein [Deltaproteobacteria bacterium]
MTSKECYDHLIIRCPSLGGEVPFSYCRKQGKGDPCPRLPRCWMKLVDIETYIKDSFTPEEITAFFLQPPSGRMDKFISHLTEATATKKPASEEKK